PLPSPVNGLASLGIPPNWSSCSSSPISFWAPSGNARRFLFASPIQTTGRNTGGAKSVTGCPKNIGNLLYLQTRKVNVGCPQRTNMALPSQLPPRVLQSLRDLGGLNPCAKEGGKSQSVCRGTLFQPLLPSRGLGTFAKREVGIARG